MLAGNAYGRNNEMRNWPLSRRGGPPTCRRLVEQRLGRAAADGAGNDAPAAQTTIATPSCPRMAAPFPPP